MRKPNLLLATYDKNTDATLQNPDINLTYSARVLGEKEYELTNHLGNVLAVVSDKRLPNDEPDVISASDYYPYGMLMPDRNYDAEEYRYGFNTQEKVPELNSSHTTALFWEYDGRLGRRWNLDPINLISISNYAAFEDNSINITDFNGQQTRPSQPPRYYRPPVRRYNNYARDFYTGQRMLSTRTTRTTTYTISAYRQTISEAHPSYIYEYTSPNKNTTQISKVNNPLSYNRDYKAETIALIGDLVQIKVERIEKRINTPVGIRIESDVNISFIDFQKQQQYFSLQKEYEKEFQERLLNIT